MKNILQIVLCLMYSALAMAQHTVNGRVTDASGEQLVGVNIVEKGTYNGTSTNLNGEYSFQVSSPTSTLIFSYFGFATQEVSLNGQSELNITLEEGIVHLGEVQVVGTRSYTRTAVETPVAIDIIGH